MNRRKNVVLAIGLLGAAALTGCGSKETPYERYMAAQKILSQAEGVKFDTQGSLKVGVTGVTVTMDLGMDGAMKKAGDGGDMEMAMGMDLGIMGESVEMDVWYHDGYYYIDAMGEKAKSPTETGDIQEQLEGQMGMVELDEDDFESIEAKKDGDTVKITYTMDGDKLQSMIDLVLGLANQGTDAQDLEFSLDEAGGTLVVDEDNNPISNEISLNMQITADGQQIEMGMDFEITYEEIGDEVEVTFPDFTQFPESAEPAVA